ncbi:MAG TPA: hypothetical protein ACN46O_03135 [Prochlorococcus sp.]|nr:hypothetical protein [Prochlorococcaceae cyanobacterium ETNP18_MAG_17]MDP6851854.1 hypothetical protein [Prochlorococcaceae cyanobacterium ETNP1_MAG_8]HJL68933.1 hypothetical protein [Prochlorococcaceae cyanobacterium Gl_MAG_24]
MTFSDARISGDPLMADDGMEGSPCMVFFSHPDVPKLLCLWP